MVREMWHAEAATSNMIHSVCQFYGSLQSGLISILHRSIALRYCIELPLMLVASTEGNLMVMVCRVWDGGTREAQSAGSDNGA